MQSVRHLFNGLERGSIDPALDKAEEVHRDPDEFGELLLSQVTLQADAFEPAPELSPKLPGHWGCAEPQCVVISLRAPPNHITGQMFPYPGKGRWNGRRTPMSNNIVRARVTIFGMRPLLQHAFGPEALPLEKGEKTGVAGNDPEEWRRTSMTTAEGQLFVRGTYVFGMLRDAAKHTKKGKGSIQPLVSSTLQVIDEKVLLDRWLPKDSDGKLLDPSKDSSESVYVDVAGVRNPSTRARNVRYRLAASAGWEATFELQWDKTVVPRDQMKAVVTDAGTLVGLGDGRSVGYGRFGVRAFKFLIDEPEKADSAGT